MHNDGKHLWERRVFEFPLIHEFDFGFGLSLEDETKNSTIVPYQFQDNALVDYELIKTNPENADFATVAYPNVMAGSYVPWCLVNWMMFLTPTDVEVSMAKVNTMKIHTSMLNRLDAFDKKTGNDVETIIELEHETTDEQTGPLWANVKLFESQGTYDYHANVPNLTGTQQPESVAFDKALYFQARQYYTNKEMLNKVTDRMKTWTLTEPIVPKGRSIITSTSKTIDPVNKFAQPYSFTGELFHVPQVGQKDQYHQASQTTAIEHVTVVGSVFFPEVNPDFNFARA